MKSLGVRCFGGRKTNGPLVLLKKAAQTMIDVQPLLKVGCKHSGSYFSFFWHQTLISLDSFPISNQDLSDQTTFFQSLTVQERWEWAKLSRFSICFLFTKAFLAANWLWKPKSWACCWIVQEEMSLERQPGISDSFAFWLEMSSQFSWQRSWSFSFLGPPDQWAVLTLPFSL
jgi:hypothetical protein